MIAMSCSRPARWGRPFAVMALLSAVAAVDARAAAIGGVEFPEGASSFADAVVAYSPVIIGGSPGAADRNPSAALAAPDHAGLACSDPASCTYVSLGQGGSLTVEFVDNRLRGSGDSALDLWIFEVGADVEDTFVSISRDGVVFFDVGKVFGATAGIDIDAFGHGRADEFRFVRLVDDPREGANSGADIDAVGAISSRTVLQVPLPSTAWLLSIGLVCAGLWRRGRHR